MAEIDLLDVRCGSVTAPAGCGKTQLIADSLGRHSDRKPILILTHTNAGVAALRSRLERAGVKSSSYRLATLDGWALRTLKTFPARSEIDVDHLELADPRNDYPAIKQAAASLLAGTHIDDILDASYSRVIVDEYQDCGSEQHQMVCHLSTVLPTVVLGDPMQEIFSWQGAHPPTGMMISAPPSSPQANWSHPGDGYARVLRHSDDGFWRPARY
ncbi:UvrD-helicase domain-containing protein [Sinorhizobium meliloti]|uniref:UvrD-helicase domain-containing protein n=1 Tax=Rhizobium meliloti TaxID=382 RepID=UPI001A9DC5F6